MIQTPNPRIINYGLALEQAAGNEALAKELFEMLLAELPKLQQDLQLALQTKDRPACRDHVHKLYGATAYTGVPGLKEATGHLDNAVKQDDKKLMAHYFAVVSIEIERILDAGQSALKQDWNKLND